MQRVSGTKPRIRWNQKLCGCEEIRDARGEENKRLHQELLEGLANGLCQHFVNSPMRTRRDTRRASSTRVR